MKGDIFILKPLDVGFGIERIRIADYKIPQVDRIEEKVDRILELLEGQEMSTSLTIDGERIGEILEQAITDGSHQSFRSRRL